MIELILIPMISNEKKNSESIQTYISKVIFLFHLEIKIIQILHHSF